MSKERLIELVMNAYAANIESKKYFEFFLSPDVDKLFNNHRELVVKELRRSKWGRSKARISTIRKLIKDFAAYDPGDEYVLDFMFFALTALMREETYLNFPDTLYNGTIKLATEIMKYADTHSLIKTAITKFDNLLIQEKIGTRAMLRDVKEAVASYSGQI